jgi:histidinol phosphatase-like PHP family hydrolase
VGPEDLGLALVFATGAPEHVALLVARAGARGVKLSPAASEEDVYARLGLPFIPPELREGTDELELAERGALPRLVTRDDLMGAVHCHTTYSDGVASVEAMAQGAEALGLRYITITDHSPAAHYANGLDAARLRQQWAEMARVQRGVGVKLLRGVECDILKDGSLDCAPELVEELDVVIASIHQRFKLDQAGMTRRVVTAMRQAPFKIWGHGLGRYVLSRPPIDCDVPAVLDAIAESRAAIELNGDPHRLDLEPRWVREAKKRGIAFVVSSDAHSVNGLRNADYGVDMARRAGLEADDVLNARRRAAFEARSGPRQEGQLPLPRSRRGGGLRAPRRPGLKRRGHDAQVRDERAIRLAPRRLVGGAQDRRRVSGREHDGRQRALERAAAIARHAKGRTHHGQARGGAQQQHQLRFHELELGLEPRIAGADLAVLRLFVDARLAARLEREVLHTRW